MGKVLYRYRDCTQNNINALENDDIWFSTPLVFNDYLDSEICFDDKILFPMFKEYFKPAVEEVKKSNIKVDEEFEYWAGFKRFISETFFAIKSQIMIACFTEDVENKLMWSHYSNSFKGFAIKYDKEELKRELEIYAEKSIKIILDKSSLSKENEFKIKRQLEKSFLTESINYKNSMKDFTKELKPIFQKVFDNDIFKADLKVSDIEKEIIDVMEEKNIKIDVKDYALNKYTSWSYEKEWRLIGYNPSFFEQSVKNHYPLIKVKAKEIYIGEQMNTKDLKRICEIAVKKGIKIFAMDISYCENKEISFFELSKYAIRNILKSKE